MTSIKASIEFLSPTHIGTGEVIEPKDYFIKDRMLHLLNYNILLSEISDADRNEFMKIIDGADKDDSNLVKLRTFPEKIATSSSIMCKIPVSRDVEQEYHNKKDRLNNRLEINLFPHMSLTGLPYIPGSSLKGALRTPIVEYFAKKMDQNNLNRTLQEEKEKRGRKRYAGVEPSIMGYGRDIRNDIFRAIKIPDITLNLLDTEIFYCYNFNPKKPQSGSFDMRMECANSMLNAPDKSKTYGFEFIFNKELIEKGLFPKIFSIEEMGSSANDHYLKILRHEVNIFFRYDKRSFPFVDHLDNLTINDDQFLIRLGRFGHVESKTLDGYRDPAGRMGYGKTRTLADNIFPMGWAIVTIPGYKFSKPKIGLDFTSRAITTKNYKKRTPPKHPNREHEKKQSKAPIIIPPKEDNSLKGRLQQAKVSSSQDKFIEFVKSIKPNEIPLLEKISFQGMDSIINIGMIPKMAGLEISSDILKLVALKMLDIIKPKKKWIEGKKENYRKLQAMASSVQN